MVRFADKIKGILPNIQLPLDAELTQSDCEALEAQQRKAELEALATRELHKRQIERGKDRRKGVNLGEAVDNPLPIGEASGIVPKE